MDYIQRAKKFRAKKSLGQNFLVDGSAINTIIENANLQAEDVVLEIGAGLGFVTEQIAQRVSKVYAVEIDKAAIEELKKLPFDNIEIVEQDILKTDISEIANGSKIKIIANIPYYITSPILSHLLGEIDDEENKNRKAISEILLMVQYEVARRICATPKSPNKEYGSLSILCNFYSDTEYIKKVGKRSFFPAPKVDSAILKITPQEVEKYSVQDKKLLRRIITATFQARRKTLKNALLIGGFNKNTIDAVYEKLNLEQTTRGEKLSIEELCRISDEFASSQTC
ncbi:MAG: 16S rRNA (adenine(1518)-N(6)/adenine(1519)-N(6))-dimethyltransferase RsmA [bacterium]|nr:16S rRNA (adenine(1518)-N(6)/adenine(1519)-N(6))-dimethyltransferase RsmA [bacterium]